MISFPLGKSVVGDAAPRIVPKMWNKPDKSHNSSVNLRAHIHSRLYEMKSTFVMINTISLNDLLESFMMQIDLLYWIVAETHTCVVINNIKQIIHRDKCIQR